MCLKLDLLNFSLVKWHQYIFGYQYSIGRFVLQETLSMTTSRQIYDLKFSTDQKLHNTYLSIEGLGFRLGLGLELNLIDQKKNFDRRTLQKMSANARISHKEGVWCKKNLNLSDSDT